MSDLKPNIDVSKYKLNTEQVSVKHTLSNHRHISLDQLSSEFNHFEQIDNTDTLHIKALSDLLPKYLLAECYKTDLQLFLAMSRYDRKNNTYVIGCFDNQDLDFKLISYKWRYKDGIKWKTRAGTNPNSIPLIRIYTEDRPVYVIEGHRDSATAILLGLDFIMLPYAGYRIKENPTLAKEVIDRKLIFLVEDEAAYKCMLSVANILKKTARDIELKSLVSHVGKVDLSDYVQRFNSIKEVINDL